LTTYGKLGICLRAVILYSLTKYTITGDE